MGRHRSLRAGVTLVSAGAAGETGVIVAVIGRPARPYGSVTAPRSAPVTNRAYLASTPVV